MELSALEIEVWNKNGIGRRILLNEGELLFQTCNVKEKPSKRENTKTSLNEAITIAMNILRQFREELK